MRRLLLAPLLIVGFLSPIAVNAKSVWLIVKWAGWSYHNAGGMEKIEMEDMDQCELMGAKWIASKRTFTEQGERFEDMTFVCIEGK